MSKYLDFDGVKYLWSKIKKNIDGRIINSFNSDNPEENAPSIQAVIDNVAPPQNLLINGDFKIWQRGEAFTIQGNGGKAYTADMWEIRNQRTSSAQMIHQKTDEGKGTGFGFPGLGSMRIYQWLPIEEMRQYDGKYMTRVWSVNKQVHSETFLLNLSASNGTIEGDKWRAFYYLSNSDDVLNYAALYPGKIAYPHFEEDDATALARCQKFFIRKGISTVPYYKYGSGEDLRLGGEIPSMESVPTVNITGCFSFDNTSAVNTIRSVTSTYVSDTFYLDARVVFAKPMHPNCYGVILICEISCEPL